MKLIKFAAFLFYRYYSEGRWNGVPYFRTIIALGFLGYIHLLQILFILDRVDLLPIKSSQSHDTKRLMMFLILLPICLMMRLLIKESELKDIKEQYAYSWDKIFNANVWLIVYIVLSFSSLIILMIVKTKH